MFWFFGLEACGILAPRPAIEPVPHALEGKVLTPGPPGKSCVLYLKGSFNQLTLGLFPYWKFFIYKKKCLRLFTSNHAQKKTLFLLNLGYFFQ